MVPGNQGIDTMLYMQWIQTHLFFGYGYELHLGQAMASSENNAVRQTCCLGRGGAMPYSFSLFLPASLIQSVVQAGDSTVLTLTFPMPFSISSIRILAEIISIAGQPVYVGVMITSTEPSSDTMTSLMMPRSMTDNTGTSGSFTFSRIDQIAAVSYCGKMIC